MAGDLSVSHRISLTVLGFSAMVTQVILVRETLALFSGNELVIGLALGIWMLLTALGARFSGLIKSVPTLHLLLAISSLLTAVILHLLRSLLVGPGIMAGLSPTFLALLAAMLPFCIFSGALFPLLVQQSASKKMPQPAPVAYAVESAGSIAGGIIFSLALVYLLDNWQSLAVVFSVNMLVSQWIWWNKDNKMKSAATAGAWIAVVAWTVVADPAAVLERLHYPGQDVIEMKDSPYGRLVATRLNGQVTIFENGRPHAQLDDVVTREEMVHYAMLVKSDASRVLMISGGMSGALQELLKYPHATADYVETDPSFTAMAEKYGGLTANSRIRIIHRDPKRFVMNCKEKYDVILLNAPDPESGLSNRLFTVTFFRELKKCLKEEGLLSVSIQGGSNYLSKESLRLHAVINNSLKKEFKQVGLVPGQRHFFLASDKLPMKMFGEAYQDAGIENSYVNPSYINELQLGQRSQEIMRRLAGEKGLNTDVRPIGYWLVVQQWLGQSGVNQYLVPIVLLLSLLAFFVLLKPLDLGLFTAGLTAGATELILLLWLQSVFGYVYQVAGLVFAVFMAGLALGAWKLPKYFRALNYPLFLRLQGVMIGLIFIIIAYVYLSESMSLAGWINLALIFLLVAASGAVTGLQFATGVVLRKGDVRLNSARAYSSDLAGSALGALLVGVFCIPLLGIYGTGFALAGADLIALTLLIYRKPA